MPSKTSKRRSRTPSRKPAALQYSERELAAAAADLARELRPGDRVILEGPMGAGKSTFARLLIEALGVSDRQAGSPTFAIVHEYHSGRMPIIHMDLYRIRSPHELEDAGIPAYFWERNDAVVIVEWLSLFPGLEREVVSAPPRGVSNRRVSMDFARTPDRRLVSIERLGV